MKIINYCIKTSLPMSHFFDCNKYVGTCRVWLGDVGIGYHMTSNDMIHILQMGNLEFGIVTFGYTEYDPNIPAKNYEHVYVLSKNKSTAECLTYIYIKYEIIGVCTYIRMGIKN